VKLQGVVISLFHFSVKQNSCLDTPRLINSTNKSVQATFGETKVGMVRMRALVSVEKSVLFSTLGGDARPNAVHCTTKT
jgi:hypothetical protein